jgi:hypothetical protein
MKKLLLVLLALPLLFSCGGSLDKEITNAMLDDGYTGKGTYTFADGSKYVGEYNDGMIHGQGTLTTANGSKYVGEFKDGMMHGQGTKTWADVTITAEKNIQDCHMCPGYLLIERKTIDTLKRGSWGLPPKFKQFKSKGRDYIALESFYSSGGINESNLSILSLNEDNYLTSVFDTLISDEQISSLKINRRNIEFRAPDTLLVNQSNKISNSNDESNIRADSLSELYIIKTQKY